MNFKPFEENKSAIDIKLERLQSGLQAQGPPTRTPLSALHHFRVSFQNAEVELEPTKKCLISESQEVKFMNIPGNLYLPYFKPTDI